MSDVSNFKWVLNEQILWAPKDTVPAQAFMKSDNTL